jgi:hypothetical protein
LPSGESPDPSASVVLEMTVAPLMWPMTLLEMGATSVRYLSIRALIPASGWTSVLVTIRFCANAAGPTMSCVPRLSSRWTSVTSRPNDSLVNNRGLPAGSVTVQL